MKRIQNIPFYYVSSRSAFPVLPTRKSEKYYQENKVAISELELF